MYLFNKNLGIFYCSFPSSLCVKVVLIIMYYCYNLVYISIAIPSPLSAFYILHYPLISIVLSYIINCAAGCCHAAVVQHQTGSALVSDCRLSPVSLSLCPSIRRLSCQPLPLSTPSAPLCTPQTTIRCKRPANRHS